MGLSPLDSFFENFSGITTIFDWKQFDLNPYAKRTVPNALLHQ